MNSQLIGPNSDPDQDHKEIETEITTTEIKSPTKSLILNLNQEINNLWTEEINNLWTEEINNL